MNRLHGRRVAVVFERRLLAGWGVVIWLWVLCEGSFCFGAEEVNEAEPNFTPGQEVRVNAKNKQIGGGHFMVYVPSDYTADKDWPVIFVYHGMNGQPTTWPMRQATKGEGFIVIGMGYVEHKKGRVSKGEYADYLKRERRSVLEVRRYAAKYLRIDEKRMFVSGFSMGGWHTSEMLEVSPKFWAGGVIFAAGRSRNLRAVSDRTDSTALRGKPIYIAAGETDENLKAAKKAVVFYEQLGAKVTFEEFKGCGHGFDPSGSQLLYSWLIANGWVGDDESDAGGKKPASETDAANKQDEEML